MTRDAKGAGLVTHVLNHVLTHVRRTYEMATSSEAESGREKLVDGVCLVLLGALLFLMAVGWLCVAGFLVWWLLFA